MAKPTGKGSATARGSAVGADYLNTRQLFSQDDSQTQDLDDAEGLAEERRIQRAFLEATEQHNRKDGRRVTFTEVATENEELLSPGDGDELQVGDDELDTSLTIKDILANLDEGAEQFAGEAQARPQYVYNLMGKLCSSLRLLQEHNDLLHQSNDRNLKMREQLTLQHADAQEMLQEATAKINELAQGQDPQDEARASAQLGKMKEKNQWYAEALKSKDAVVNQLNNDAAGLAQENDDLKDECFRLREELAADQQQHRGRSHSRREPEASLSPYSKAHAMGPPPLPRRDLERSNRRQARSESRARSQRDHAQRTRRENTAATDNSRLTTTSRASVNLDPESSKAIVVDRSVKDPDKFEGKANTFYPWLTAMTLKLSTATFRTEGDGLRYVQGFLGSPP